MNPIPALLAPAPIAPTAAPSAAPNPTAPENNTTESFDAALQREVQARQTPDDAAVTSANPAPSTGTEGCETDTEAAPDEAQIHEDVQALIASLTMLPPQKTTDTTRPATQSGDTAADTNALRTATNQAEQPASAETETGERAVITATTPARHHQQAAAWQPRTDTAVQTTAQTKPENAAASTPAGAPDMHAAAVQAPPVMAAAPPAAAFTLQESPAAPSLHLAPRVSHPGWDQALGQRVLWLAGSGHQQASLTINPPQLGPVQVTLQLQDNQAIASFVSGQPEVRQALEAAMPKLREMMNEAGLQLSQAHVHAGSDPNAGQHARSGQHSEQASASNPGLNDMHSSGVQMIEAPARLAGQGIVDIFA